MKRWIVVLLVAAGIALLATLASAQSCTLKSGATCTITGSFPIPAGTLPGDYRVCFKAVDAKDHVGKDSNTACMTVTVVDSPPLGTDVEKPFTWLDRNVAKMFPVELASGFRCERQTGSSSLMLIFSNGTLLKSAGIPNPAVNVEFKLRCQTVFDRLRLTTTINAYVDNVLRASYVMTGPPPPPPVIVADVRHKYTYGKDITPYVMSDLQLSPYSCLRKVGGTAQVTITSPTATKTASLANPVKGVEFEMRCLVTDKAVQLYVDDVLKLTVPR